VHDVHDATQFGCIQVGLFVHSPTEFQKGQRAFVSTQAPVVATLLAAAAVATGCCCWKAAIGT